jgi:hypothetical protein
MITNNTIAIIAAGGYGRRLRSRCPKSLLRVADVSMLQYTLHEVAKLGLKKILVYTDRPEYLTQYSEICTQYGIDNIQVIPHVKSTFEIIKRYHATSDNDILFLYGHIPHSLNHYSKLFRASGSLVCSAHDKSTMKRLNAIKVNLFLEPPYLIDHSLLKNIQSENWQDFFKNSPFQPSYILDDAPNEFNYYQEYVTFRNFVLNHLSYVKREMLQVALSEV